MEWPRRLSPAGTRLTLTDLWAAWFGTAFLGNQRRRLRDELTARFAVRYAFLTNSGRAALTVILGALSERDSRNEVIIPAYTCFSVPSAIRKAGLKVRLVDVQESSFDYDFDKLEAAISNRTLAILMVYPFGLGCDVRRIQQIARNHGVYLIEDVAQSIGLTFGGQLAGTIGDVGFYSLSKGKPITAIRGGIIVTNRDDLAQGLLAGIDSLPSAGVTANLKVLIEAKIIWLFLRPWLFWIIGKLPFVKLGETHYDPAISMKQMPRASAVLCRRMLRRLDALNDDRAKVAGNYLSGLQGTPLQPVTGTEPKLSRFLRFPILCSDQATRDRLFDRLQELGGSRMYHEPLFVIDDPELFAGGRHAAASFPNAERISKRLLTLPTHVYTRPQDVEAIIAVLRSATVDGSRADVAR